MTIKFTNPAINYYVEDVENAARFYIENFGFVETFRTPKEGTPVHVEASHDSFILGFASKKSAQTMHGLPLGQSSSPRCELVIWTENVDDAYTTLVAKGIPSISAPHDFLSSLRAAWIADPEGNPVQIVSRQTTEH